MPTPGWVADVRKVATKTAEEMPNARVTDGTEEAPLGVRFAFSILPIAATVAAATPRIARLRNSV